MDGLADETKKNSVGTSRALILTNLRTKKKTASAVFFFSDERLRMVTQYADRDVYQHVRMQSNGDSVVAGDL